MPGLGEGARRNSSGESEVSGYRSDGSENSRQYSEQAFQEKLHSEMRVRENDRDSYNRDVRKFNDKAGQVLTEVSNFNGRVDIHNGDLKDASNKVERIGLSPLPTLDQSFQDRWQSLERF